MLNQDLHLSDQELLLAADGELPVRRATQVHAHLAACWSCRARMAEIEATIADFARAHRQTLDPQLPPIAGPRALLRAQLAELASKREPSSWRRLFQFTPSVRAAAVLCAGVVMAALAGGLLLQHSTPGRTNANRCSVGARRGSGPQPYAGRHAESYGQRCLLDAS